MTRFLKITLTTLFFILLIFLGFWFLKNPSRYDTAIGGWEPVRASVEARYSNNADLREAALQMAKALQMAVDTPDDAVKIEVELAKAMSCVLGVMEKQGAGIDLENSTLEDIRDLATRGYERERRYIHFNVSNPT